MTARVPSGSVSRSLLALAATAALALAGALTLLLTGSSATAHAQGEAGSVLMYTGTTGYRHGGGQSIDDDAVNTTIGALEDAGFEVDYRTCNGATEEEGNGDPSLVTNNNLVGCRHPTLANPAIFTPENLSNYDAIYFHSASDFWSGASGWPGAPGEPGQLFDADEEVAIISFVQNGGGVAAIHNATDAGAGSVTWDWWDGDPESMVGTTMPGHAATDLGNQAEVQVNDHNHPSTADLPDSYDFGGEHYNWNRNVRGTHHVLANFDERTYEPGGNGMGQDHPISWCKLYDGEGIEDGTGEPKNYNDGRIWITGMGHFAQSFTENGGDNNLVNHIVGGVEWVAGGGNKSDCSGTDWSSYSREVLVEDTDGAIAVDVADDGKVYWTELGTSSDGQYPAYDIEGYVRMHDPEGPPSNNTIVGTIPIRADTSNSEDGVLGMSLEPGFDLTNPDRRDIYVYYSPRGEGEDWPTTGNDWTVGYNLISRFTINADGTAFVPGSEQEVLRVDKAKISGAPEIDGTPADANPGHVGGASLVFDAEGNLVIGIGDDVSPNASGHNTVTPLDYRATERRDARKTSANTGDLRGKILRIDPIEGASGIEPGEGQTYEIPPTNMFAGDGDPLTRGEIFAMGFRQPFTVHADPENPDTIVAGEFCHDNSSNVSQRAPAGVCEWNLVDEPAFHGWPFCVGDNSPINTSWKWDYDSNSPTGEQHDCSQSEIPSDLDYAPPGGTNPGVTNEGAATVPGPAADATIWKKYPGNEGEQDELDFGDLSNGGMQPVTGPIYRWNGEPAGIGGRFPAYWDGSWLIHNRGAGEGGFWKEVRLRQDNNEMLRVHDIMPYNNFGTPTQSRVIGTRFGPDGALYMVRYPTTCCRNGQDGSANEPLIKIEFNVQDQCVEDEDAPNVSHEIAGPQVPGEEGSYYNSAELTISARDVGCAGVDGIEYRIDSDSPDDWEDYLSPIDFEDPGTYTVDYRATDTFGNVSELGEATFTVVAIDDQTPPETTLTIDGEAPESLYTEPVEIGLDAVDPENGGEVSGVETTEYVVDGGDPVVLEAGELPHSFDVSRSGEHTIEYRSTDVVGNEEPFQEVTFAIEDGLGAISCVTHTSDDFDGLLPHPAWEILREDAGAWSIGDGTLDIELQGSGFGDPPLDMQGGSATANNVFLQDAPEGPWQATTSIDTSEIFGGFGGIGGEAGIIVWESEDPNTFSKLVLARAGFFDEGASAEHVHTADDEADFDEARDAADVGEVDAIMIRATHTALGEIYGEYSLDDGETWELIGTAASVGHFDGPLRVGVMARRDFSFGDAPTAAFDSLRVEATECPDVPENVRPPFLTASGAAGRNPETVEVGSKITCHQGRWTPKGKFEFTWLRDEGDGYEAVEVGTGPDQTGSRKPKRYVARADHAGAQVACQVTRSGRDGSSAPAYSEPTTIASDEPDTTPPVTTAQLNGADPEPTYDGDVEVTLTASDPGENASGVDFTEYRVDSDDPGDWTTYDPASPPTVSGEGDHEVDYRSTDVAGNVEEAQTVAFAIDVDAPDTTPPVTTVQLNGADPVPTYDGDVEVTLSATDPGEDASGVDFTEYRVDSDSAEDWTTYDPASPPTVSGEGEHEVDYRSTDVAGNVEEAQTVAFAIDVDAPDTTPPVTTVQLNGADPVPTYDGDVEVTLTASDPGENASGVDFTEYRVDSDDPGDWQTHSPLSPPTVSGEGDHEVDYRSTDVAGNVEEAQTVAFAIELGTEPVTHEVDSVALEWVPDQIAIDLGDEIQWNFDPELTSFPHDVWLVPAGGDRDPDGEDIFELTDGTVPPGGDPVAFTPDQQGEWMYICRVHSFWDEGNQEWAGTMFGFAQVE